MKRIFFLGLLLMAWGLPKLYSQPALGVRISWMDPTFRTGYIRSPVPSAQIHLVTKRPDRTTRVELFLGVAHWKSRQDSIPLYEVHTRNGSTFLAGGYMTHQFFPSVFLGATINKRWSRDDFTGFMSCDLRFNFDSYIQEVEIPEIRSSNDLFLPNLFGGLLPTVGVSYLYDDSIDFQLGIGAAFLISRYYQIQTYWDPSIKVTFGL